MAEQRLSISFTTYQIGKIYFIGLKAGNDLSVFERSFNRCMGLCASTNGLYMSSLYQVWRFENVLEPGQQQDEYDRLYVPQVGSTTGDLDIHDMAVDSDGRLIFVNTLFGCLATLSETHSFKPVMATILSEQVSSRRSLSFEWFGHERWSTRLCYSG